MPSDASGVYSLPNGYEAITGETIQASQHNPPLEDLASAMSARLMRSGAAPMTGALKIINGSSGSPAVQFSSAPATGWFKTLDGIGVSVDGTKVAEFTSSGVSRMLGELVPWTLLSAPSGWVLPYGQALSRTTYADLWAIAQTEIAAGNTFFNNGNGTTTFGIGDLRGRLVAGKDDMGGAAANRLTSGGTGFSTTTLGAAGGVQIVTLTTAQIPSHVHANSLNDPGHTHAYTSFTGTQQGVSGSQALMGNSASGTTSTGLTGISITNANAGGGEAHGNVQPTMICNFILYVGA